MITILKNWLQFYRTNYKITALITIFQKWKVNRSDYDFTELITILQNWLQFYRNDYYVTELITIV